MSQPSPKVTLSSHRFGLWAIGLAAIAFATWIWLAPLNGAVVSIGLVKAETSRKLVQHTDGGIVKRIWVKNGDTVRAGQVLMELEDIKTDANAQLFMDLTVFEAIKRDRLDAEQQFIAEFKLSAERRKSFDPALIEKSYGRELNIFRIRRDLLNEQLASYQRQQQSVTEEQSALRKQLEASKQAAQLARDELILNEGLVRDKFVSRARLISLERAVAEYGAKQGEHEALLAQSEQRKNDLGLRAATARSEYQRVATEEFKESNARLVQLREQLRPVQDASRRKSVLATVSGKVVGLRFNAPGEVAPPREPLMEIVPDNEEQVVEAQVGVDTIRHLRLDQKAELRFTAFNSRTTPMVQGSVSYVSADALSDKDGQPYYLIQVRPQAASVKSAGIAALKPGMAAEVYVLMESRSVIDYLLTPITDTLRRAFREP